MNEHASRAARYRGAALASSITSLMLMVMMVAAATGAAAQEWPTRPLRLVVPHAPGGNADAFARVLAPALGERLGQQVVVDNRAGAGGTIAMGMVAKAPADGYTLGVADTGTHAIAPSLYGGRLPYDVFKDFTLVNLSVNFTTVLLLHPSVPATTPREFVTLVKSRPGQLDYASAGTGNGSHLAQDLFLHAAGGLKMQHLPYKGGAPAVQALIAGEAQMSAVSVNTALPHVRSGRLKALALASSKRNPALPDVPTLAEYGIEGAEADNWLAIVGPAGIPPEIVTRLHEAIKASLDDAQVRERLAANGLSVVAGDGGAFRRVLQADEKKWGDVVRMSGASAQ